MHNEQMKKRRKANRTVGIELRPEVESLDAIGLVEPPLNKLRHDLLRE